MGSSQFTAATPNMHHRRDETPDFDPQNYYILENPTFPNFSLSAGVFQDSQGAISMTATGSLSSENWQLFPQGGRYFIRNYDYGAQYQLGLTENSRSTPKLYARSGSVAQQWSIIKVEGGWELVNGLWGNGTSLMLPQDWRLPAMRSEDGAGGSWNITGKPDTAKSKPMSSDMLSEVEGFQILTPTPSPSPSPSQTTSIVSGIVPSPTGSPTSVSAPTAALSNPSSSNSLSAAVIAGICIALVVLLVTVALAIWFFVVRKRRANPENRYELHGQTAEVGASGNEKYAYKLEMHAIPEIGSSGVIHKVELDSNSAFADDTQRLR